MKSVTSVLSPKPESQTRCFVPSLENACDMRSECRKVKAVRSDRNKCDVA